MALVAGFVALLIFGPPWGVVAVIAGAVVEIGESVLWWKYLQRFRVKTGAEGLIGRPAKVEAECHPEGRVRISGEIWRARCPDGAAVGEEVLVGAVEGLTLVVEPQEGRPQALW